MKAKLSLLSLAAALVVGIAGCTPEARTEYDQAGDKVADAAEATGKAVATDASKTGEVLGKAAQNAAEAADDATDKAQIAAAASETSIKVKNAILTADNLEAKNLDVDTIGKTVYLKGSVPTAENRSRAEKIAKQTVGGTYTVLNELAVR